MNVPGSHVSPRSCRVRRAQGLFGLLALLSVTVAAPAAQAEDEFEVTVTKGQVVVVAKGEWHINQEFPWKLVVGATKLDKTKFTLAEKTATISNAPSGEGKVKGAVCSHDSCHTLEKQVTIP
ncbi:MAG TPA: hypothetical protein VH044_06900 [Polyangiaceae bacterium]|jgi:hypothetical protein|nr:hypothetical protein [Polyangiaceae bacterium]